MCEYVLQQGIIGSTETETWQNFSWCRQGIINPTETKTFAKKPTFAK